MTMYRLTWRNRNADGDETHERREPLDEYEAARELAAELFIHEMDGWTARMGIGRVVCWRGTTERIIEAREYRP